MAEKAGKKIKVPVEVLAASNPIAKPRRLTNQRLTILADRTGAMQPLPNPDNTPHNSTNCQAVDMKRLRPVDRLISASAAKTVRRTPKRCIRAAAKGPVMPNRKMPTAAAKEIMPRDQPK